MRSYVTNNTENTHVPVVEFDDPDVKHKSLQIIIFILRYRTFHYKLAHVLKNFHINKKQEINWQRIRESRIFIYITV